MGFAEQEHQSTGLADASADGERQLVVDDALVVGKFEIVEEVRDLELAAESLGVDADAHGSEYMAALRDVVPDQDVAVESVRVARSLLAGVSDPVVVIGGTILVRQAVEQRPADTDDEHGG